MIISYGKHGKSGGAVEYVAEKERKGVTIVRGDPQITKQLIEECPHKLKYRSGVISFEEKEITQKARDEILDLFEKSTFAGLEKDQYNVLFVEHKDTDNYHIHFVIPRMELRTGKSFNPHWHEKDQTRLLKIQEYVNAKYGYTSAFSAEKRQTLVMDTKQNNKMTSKEQIHNVIENEIIQGRINNRDEIISFFKNNGIAVTRQGKDYISVRLDDEKVRLKGIYYAETFTNLGAVGAELERAEQANRAVTPTRLNELRKELDELIQRQTEQNRERYGKELTRNSHKRATIEKQTNPSHEHSLNDDRVNFEHVVHHKGNDLGSTQRPTIKPRGKTVHNHSRSEADQRHQDQEQALLANRRRIDDIARADATRRARERETAQLFSISATKAEPNGLYKRIGKNFEAIRERIIEDHKQLQSGTSEEQSLIREVFADRSNGIQRIKERFSEFYERAKEFVKEQVVERYHSYRSHGMRF